MFIHFWETETACEWGRCRERGRQESKTCSRLWAVSTEPNVALKSTNCEIMTWAEVEYLTDWAIQVPRELIFKFHQVRNYICFVNQILPRAWPILFYYYFLYLLSFYLNSSWLTYSVILVLGIKCSNSALPYNTWCSSQVQLLNPHHLFHPSTPTHLPSGNQSLTHFVF